MPRDILFRKKNKGIPPSERKKAEAAYRPEESARDWLDRMNKTIEDCDMNLFAMFMANIYSNAERALCKGNITKSEMIALKESAAHKVIGFTKNCECLKKPK